MLKTVLEEVWRDDAPSGRVIAEARISRLRWLFGRAALLHSLGLSSLRES